jgi:hypothetical protein
VLHIAFNDARGVPHCLIELQADQTDYLQQVVDIDAQQKVHHFGLESVERLQEYRIGGPGCVKTAFAVVHHETNTLKAVIFAHKNDKPIRNGADLQGNVAGILREKANRAFKGDPTAMVFYEISSVPKSGMGPVLINTLLRNTQGFVPATLSPFRSVTENFPEFEGAMLSPEETLVLGFSHMMQRKNPTQRFHMGNGAIIRNINVNANTPDSEDGVKGRGMMVNYGYMNDASEQSSNRTKFHALNNQNNDLELLELMEPHLLKRVLNCVQAGALPHFVSPAMADRMQALTA